MNDAFDRFQEDISTAQQEFLSKSGKVTDQELYTLKDATFTALSALSQSVEDSDLRQMLARSASRVHLFPINRDGWKEELVLEINSAVSAAFQIISFLEEDGATMNALAA